MLGLSRAAATAKARGLLDRMGLTGRERHYPREPSHERTRAFLARMTAG